MTIYMTDKEYKTLRRMVRRNVYQNLRRLDRKLEASREKFERTFKGVGDIIGILMSAAGAVLMVLCLACADSIATEYLNTWGFILICSFASVAAGVKILSWMRH